MKTLGTTLLIYMENNGNRAELGDGQNVETNIAPLDGVILYLATNLRGSLGK